MVSERRIADIKLSPEWPVTAPSRMGDLGSAQSLQAISKGLQKLRSAFKSYVHLTLQTTVFRVRPTYLGISMWRFSRRGVLPLLSPNLFHVSHFVFFSLLDLALCLEEVEKVTFGSFL